MWYTLFNIRKIRLFHTQYPIQLLVQIMVHQLQQCPSNRCAAVQNAAAHIIFNHANPLLIKLHWLPVAACIKFTPFVQTYRVLAGCTPSYLNSLVRASAKLRRLCSARVSSGKAVCSDMVIQTIFIQAGLQAHLDQSVTDIDDVSDRLT